MQSLAAPGAVPIAGARFQTANCGVGGGCGGNPGWGQFHGHGQQRRGAPMSVPMPMPTRRQQRLEHAQQHSQRQQQQQQQQQQHVLHVSTQLQQQQQHHYQHQLPLPHRFRRGPVPAASGCASGSPGSTTAAHGLDPRSSYLPSLQLVRQSAPTMAAFTQPPVDELQHQQDLAQKWEPELSVSLSCRCPLPPAPRRLCRLTFSPGLAARAESAWIFPTPR